MYNVAIFYSATVLLVAGSALLSIKTKAESRMKDRPYLTCDKALNLLIYRL